MKKTNSKLKTKILNRAVSITALLLAAGVLLTVCPQKVKEEPKHTVTIDGTPNGTVTAGSDISQPVYKGTVINFTAEPASGYGVAMWTITGGTIVSGGKSLDKTASVSITDVTIVKVDFDYELKLKTFTIFDEDASSGSISVDSKGKVTPSDVVAKFDYGSQTDKQILVTVTNGTLKFGENTVSLSVEGSVGNYVGWSKDIKVIIKEYITYDIAGVEFTMKGIAAVNNAQLGDTDYDNNQPHTISLSAYLIGETEVTQELWEKVMVNNPSWFDGSSGKEPAAGETQGKRPVEMVNWYECIAFCNELTKKVAELGESQCVYTVEGHTYGTADAEAKKVPDMDMSKKGFRLPTEAEWEWAAKGGKDYKWAGTNTEAELKNYAWYFPNSGYKTHEVKKKSPNGYGLYDMSGNVFEWCWDWYGTLPASPGADYAGPASGTDRVLRDGSWGHKAEDCLVGRRIDSGPYASNRTVGFRLACRP